MRTALLTLVVVFSVGSLVPAGDKKDKDKPGVAGTWSKKEGQLKIEFVDKEVVKFHPHGDKAEIALVCKYTIDKEGQVKAKLTDFEGKDELKEKINSRFPAGFEFSFQWKAKGDTASVDNVDGKDAEGLKSHLEGEYTKKTD